MNLLTEKEIKNLPVESKNGTKIGRLIGFEIEPDSQTIINYLVKPKQVVKGIFEGNLIVNREQVIEISKYKMIIDDSVTRFSQRKSEVAALSS
jgi:sporulation protein YlmC with PRC-barrel domain